MSKAKRCWDVGDYRGVATIQETLVQDGGAAKDYRRWVDALTRAGDTGTAVAVGRDAAAKYPEDANLQYYITRACFMEKRFAEALSAIDRAIALKGEEPEYLCLRADVLIQLEKYESAIGDAQAVLHQEPDHWHSLEQMINALVPLGQLGDAEVRARELVEAAPSEPAALLTASRFYASQNRLDEALKFVDKVLDIDAENELAQRLRGLILFEMEDYHGANKNLRQVASREPNSVSVHCWLADSLALFGALGGGPLMLQNI